MTEELEPISEAALEAIANLLAAAKHHGIGVTFEPDAVGWAVGYMQGKAWAAEISPARTISKLR